MGVYFILVGDFEGMGEEMIVVGCFFIVELLGFENGILLSFEDSEGEEVLGWVFVCWGMVIVMVLFFYVDLMLG